MFFYLFTIRHLVDEESIWFIHLRFFLISSRSSILSMRSKIMMWLCSSSLIWLKFSCIPLCCIWLGDSSIPFTPSTFNWWQHQFQGYQNIFSFLHNPPSCRWQSLWFIKIYALFWSLYDQPSCPWEIKIICHHLRRISQNIWSNLFGDIAEEKYPGTGSVDFIVKE